MTDNEFWQILSGILTPLVTGIEPTITLVNGFQPNAQGAPLNPLVSFFIISTKRYGWQGSSDTYNELVDDFDHSENWIVERTIQVSAMVKQDPENLDQITAFDIVNALSALLQSDSVIRLLKAAKIGILRVTDIRETFINDESAQHTETPSFDFIVTYSNKAETKAPVVIELNATIQTV